MMHAQTKVGALLHTDHMATIQTLQELEDFVVSAGRNPPDIAKRAPLLRAVVDIVRTEVDRHFGFEENELFKLFEQKGEVGIVMMLTGEHREILPLGQQVAALASQALEGGFTADSWKEFRSLASELVEREVFHIQKEEMGLLAAISMFLTPEEDAQLAARFEAMEKAA